MSDQYELVSSEQTRFIKRPNGRYCIWNEQETVDELNALHQENKRLRYLENLAEELIAKNRRLLVAGDEMFKWSERVGQEFWLKAKETKP